MPQHPILKQLLETAAEAAREDAGALARCQARVAWVEERMAALRAAQKRADDAWSRLVEAFPEDDDLPEPPEQAELDAILSELHAVAHRDMWPRHLYFTV